MARSGERSLHAVAINAYLAGHLLCGAGILLWIGLHWSCPDPLRFISYLLSAIVGAALKVRFPGVQGTQCVSFLFFFVAILDLSPLEAVAVAAIPAAVQILWHARYRPRPVQVAFAVANQTMTIGLCVWVYSRLHGLVPDPITLAALSVVYFVANTVDVGGIIALTERTPLGGIVKDAIWILPYYGGGFSAAWIVT
ncbi:MAG: hypothetical protein JO336_14015, partial [Acidobacteriia bacterium]|nr:hypothetical protein [Terriglobia bacterium]